MIPFIMSFIPKDGTSKAWPEIDDFSPSVTVTQKAMKLAVLDKGLTSGRPSVAIRLDTDDGKIIIGQTTARLFVTAANAILAKYPGLLDD